jgi:FkbM family methyltransferase
MRYLKSVLYQIIYQANINRILRRINKALYPTFTKFRLHPSGRLNIITGGGKKIKLITNQTDFVAFCVFWDGLYGYEYLDIFEEIIKKCRGFVDVGANAGLFSLLAATVNQDIKVLAIDPSQAAAYYVPKNIATNRLQKNIAFHNLALSDDEGEMTFFEVKNPKYSYLNYNLGGASSLYEKPKHYQERKVKVTTLDKLAEANPDQVSAIDFIKIDAEGAEPQIIRGIGRTINKHKPIIVCEILFGLIEKELEEVFSGYGYHFYFHKNNGLQLKESLVRETDDGVRNCFFVHPDKEWLIKEFIIDAG